MVGNNLFNAGIAEQIAKGFSGLLLTGIIKPYSNTTRDNLNLAGGLQPTADAEITFEGIITEYKEDLIDGTLIQNGDRKVLILTGSMSDTSFVPDTGDLINIEGADYFIVGNIKRDPEGATFTCQCRR